ncbi:MAG: dockerin type I repeat-containing protein [Prevotella sp.]|nr:dockerin type I repeat-containing protein [Prevotella sp.]
MGERRKWDGYESDNTSHSPDPNIVQCKLTVLAYTPGDANNDGEIDAIDFNMVGNYILGNHSQANFSFRAADFNNDGDVDAIDFNIVANSILYGSSAPARVTRAEETAEPQ